MATRESKRILSVTVRRMIDEDPDTSYFGEYSNNKSSEYSIDRKHSEDCSSLTSDELVGKLERVVEYLVHQSQYASKSDDHDLYVIYDESADIVITAQDELQECDCGESGDMGRGEYRYFNPSFNYVDSKGNLTDGNTPEEVRKYVRQDYERMEAGNRGAWCYIGIRAKARVQLNGDLVQDITSGGLWGIESDSGDSYFEEVAGEELGELKDQLHTIGFSKRAIAAAFRNVEHKEE